MTPREAVAKQIAQSGFVLGWPHALTEADALIREVGESGYLLVSEAELATALGKVIPQTAIAQSSDWNKGTDGPFPEPTRWFVADDQRLAAAIFAALVAAQEKGDAGS